MTLPGFYDGNNIWKIRFSPTKEGRWTITTHSDLPDLDKQHSQLVCIKNQNVSIHGGLQIDPVNRHHFINEDGTRWFPVGYEATGSGHLMRMTIHFQPLTLFWINFLNPV